MRVAIGPLLVKLRGFLSDTSKPRRNYVFSLVLEVVPREWHYGNCTEA